MFEVKESLINLLDRYLSRQITKHQLLISIHTDVFIYKDNYLYNLDDMLIRPFIMSFRDDYDFPSEIRINEILAILKGEKEYFKSTYITLLNIGNEHNVIRSIISDYKKNCKCILKNYAVNDFILKNIDKHLLNINDILLRSLAILIKHLPRDCSGEMHFNSITTDLTVNMVMEKIEMYLDYLDGKKGFLINALYGIDSIVYTIV